MPEATPQNGTPECCCHSPNRKCQHGHSGKHVHHCLPRGLDLPAPGHCPDGGCPGRCWETPITETGEADE